MEDDCWWEASWDTELPPPTALISLGSSGRGPATVFPVEPLSILTTNPVSGLHCLLLPRGTPGIFPGWVEGWVHLTQVTH